MDSECLDTKGSASDSFIGGTVVKELFLPRAVETGSIGDTLLTNVADRHENLFNKSQGVEALSKIEIVDLVPKDGPGFRTRSPLNTSGDCRGAECLSKGYCNLPIYATYETLDDSSEKDNSGQEPINLSGYEAEDEVDALVADWELLPNERVRTKGTEVHYEISNHIDPKHEAFDQDDSSFSPYVDWRNVGSFEKIIDDSLQSESSDSTYSKEANSRDVCESCCRKFKAPLEGRFDEEKGATGVGPISRMGNIMDDYYRMYDQNFAEESESYFDDEIDESELRAWIEGNKATRRSRKQGRSFSESDSDLDIQEVIECSPEREVEDKSIQVVEEELLDRNRATFSAREDEWLEDGSSFKVISHVSRTTQTADSFLHDQVCDSKGSLEEGQVAENEDKTTFSAEMKPLDDATPDKMDEPLLTSPLVEDSTAESDSSSVEEIPEDSNKNCESTEMSEHLEHLLDSIHHMPPTETYDGSRNLWMIPDQDENGECVNVVFDDGDTYDIYVFRPQGPVATISTQTEESEFGNGVVAQLVSV